MSHSRLVFGGGGRGGISSRKFACVLVSHQPAHAREQESFVNLRPGRFSSGASYQYHSNLPDLSHLIDTTTKSFCPGREEACLSHMSRLKAAQSLDLSYDHESQTLKATAVWPLQKQALVVSTAGRHRTEVGILTMDSRPNPEVHEQGVAGLLTVLGEQMKPSVTLFAFPSRHRQADGRFSAAFLAPTGLHPTLRLTVETTKPAPSDVKEDWNCGLYSYFTLPRVIFADKYQLNDPLFLASKNISTLSFISQPVDLEAPEYVMKIWGSSLLLELAPPKGNSKKESGPWTAHVPLHLRYLEPKEGGYSGVHIPYPAVFWACAGGAGGDGDGDGGVFAKSPFDRAHLGYDGLFEQKTLFWHVDPVPEPGAGVGGDSLMNVVIVPVADVEQTGWVSPVTLLVIMLGFGWVLERLFGALTRYRGERAIAEKVETKKTQ